MVELQQAGFRAALIPMLPEEFELPDEAQWRAGLAETLAGDGVRALVAQPATAWPASLPTAPTVT